MQLPFSEQAFFAVFAVYNESLWPLFPLLWLMSLIVLVGLVAGKLQSRVVALLLAVHWGLSGIIYHGLFFSAINPAANGFAVAFVLQALLFAVAAMKPSWLTINWRQAPWQYVGLILAVSGLVYPFVSLTMHGWPNGPVFAVPCPTALFTAGILLMTTSVRWWLLIIPFLWCLIGGAAAIKLGVITDYGLFVAALSLLLFGLVRRKPDRS